MSACFLLLSWVMDGNLWLVEASKITEDSKKLSWHPVNLFIKLNRLLFRFQFYVSESNTSSLLNRSPQQSLGGSISWKAFQLCALAMFILVNLVNQSYHLQTSKASKYKKVRSCKIPSFLNEDSATYMLKFSINNINYRKLFWKRLTQSWIVS